MKPAKIRYMLDLNNKSQADIARQLEVDPALINRVINGTTKSLRVATAIAEAIDTDLDCVFPKYGLVQQAA